MLLSEVLTGGDRPNPFDLLTGKKRGQHPAPATVMRMPGEPDEQKAAAAQGT